MSDSYNPIGIAMDKWEKEKREMYYRVSQTRKQIIEWFATIGKKDIVKLSKENTYNRKISKAPDFNEFDIYVIERKDCDCRRKYKYNYIVAIDKQKPHNVVFVELDKTEYPKSTEKLAYIREHHSYVTEYRHNIYYDNCVVGWKCRENFHDVMEFMYCIMEICELAFPLYTKEVVKHEY